MAQKLDTALPDRQVLTAWERALLAATARLGGAPALIVTVDEVGRGCLAGPVCAGATAWLVLAPTDEPPPGAIDPAHILVQAGDSKKVSEKRREALSATFWAALGRPQAVAPHHPLIQVDTAEARHEGRHDPLFPTRGVPREKLLAVTSTPAEFEVHGEGLRNGQTAPGTAWGARLTGTGDLNSLPKATFAPAAVELSLLAGAVAGASSQEIDDLGIWMANNLAMIRAVSRALAQAGAVLSGAADAPLSPEDLISSTLLVVDGDEPLKLPSGWADPIAMATVIKGDALLRTIGLSSIVAKVARDNLMVYLDSRYPGYGLAQHSGYGTKQHMQAIRDLGMSPIHRKSFRIS